MKKQSQLLTFHIVLPNFFKSAVPMFGFQKFSKTFSVGSQVLVWINSYFQALFSLTIGVSTFFCNASEWLAHLFDFFHLSSVWIWKKPSNPKLSIETKEIYLIKQNNKQKTTTKNITRKELGFASRVLSLAKSSNSFILVHHATKSSISKWPETFTFLHM